MPNITKKHIGIYGLGEISPLGSDDDEICTNYLSSNSLIRTNAIGHQCAELNSVALEKLNAIKQRHRNYRHLDKTALMAIYAARVSYEQTQWSKGKDQRIGVNIGSSRGVVESMEYFYDQYKDPQQRLSPFASPVTTLGSISSCVTQDLALSGPAFSHAMTCSSSAYALLNGVAWLTSGLCERMIIGGCETPLTGFTISQMKAMRIYSEASANDLYPCRPLSLIKDKSGMILGEAAACFAIALVSPTEKPLAIIESIGYGSEQLNGITSISEDGRALQKAMNMAVQSSDKNANIDLIITHAPGTIQGDAAEIRAIQSVFKKNIPVLTSNKWKIGHSLGASFAMSLSWAIRLINGLSLTPLPYLNEKSDINSPIHRILINATGFGGQAVSVIIAKP